MEVRAKFRDERMVIDPEDAAAELVSIISEKLPTLDDAQLHVLHGFSGKYYSTIMVNLGTRHGSQWLDYQRWHHAHINWVRQDPLEQLQEAIDAKNAKLPGYLEKCTECWLLIGVDEWTAAEAVHLSEEGLECEFECDFARVYFLRNIEGRQWRLKVRKKVGL